MSHTFLHYCIKNLLLLVEKLCLLLLVLSTIKNLCFYSEQFFPQLSHLGVYDSLEDTWFVLLIHEFFNFLRILCLANRTQRLPSRVVISHALPLDEEEKLRDQTHFMTINFILCILLHLRFVD